MDDQKITERLARDDSFWTGPRLNILLLVSVIVAVAFLFTIASVRNGDFRWSPFAHQPEREILPAGW